MIVLWRKDLPWLLVLGLGGALALALSIAERGFLEVFVLPPHRLELAHWLAGSLGLVLGVVAVVWDDVLGTREYLRQRPIAASRLAWSPMLACVAVLALWAVLVPVLAWLFAALSSGIFAPTHWRGLPEIELTLAYAWPAAAIGTLCGALPVSPFVRLVAMAALVAVVGCGIDAAAHRENGTTAPVAFGALCGLGAAVLFAIGTHVRSWRHDPDRPWPAATRLVVGGMLVLVVGLASAGAVALGQHNALASLRRAYPEPVELDGRVVLARRTDDYQRWQPVDAQHAPVGDPVDRDGITPISSRWHGRLYRLELEAPRWHEWRGAGWFRRGASLLLDETGVAWIHDVDAGIHRTGIGAELQPLPRDCSMARLDVIGQAPGVQRTVVGHAETGGLWWLDAKSDRFEALPLPDGDRFVEFEREARERFVGGDAAPRIAELFDKGTSLQCVRGERGSYVLADAGWQRVELAVRDRRAVPAPRTLAIAGDDPLTFSISIAATDAAPAFSHDYAPRTAIERGFAAIAMGASLLRPALLQAASWLWSPRDAATSPWSDPLLAGGRRWWLLVACFGCAAGCVWHVRRWLRRWGADERTVRFWTVVVAGTGLVGVLVTEFCERPRAHARRVQAVPPPAPRIVT
jgi:hypothetical protein